MRKWIYTKHEWKKVNVEKIGSPRVLAVLPRKAAARNMGEKQFRKLFPDGAVLISRRDSSRPSRRFYQIYEDGVYTGIRSRTLIDARYGAVYTRGEMREILLSINSARLYLKNLLKYRRLSPEERVSLEALIAQLAEALEKKRNFHKENARDYFELSADPYDSLGRVNPSVMCNQLATGMKYLTFRLEEIPGIRRYIERDQIHLITARDQHLTLCKTLDYRICQALERPLMKAPRKYKGEPMPRLTQWLRCHIAEFQNITVAPFTRTRYHALRDMSKAFDLARAGDYAAVKSKLLVVRNSLRFKEAQFYLEEIIMKITLLSESLKADLSKRNRDWSVGRCQDIGNGIQRLRERFGHILCDRHFERRIKTPALKLLKQAEEELFVLKLELAKQTLKSASRLM